MSSAHELMLLYTTFPNQQEAERCLTVLLQNKLVACANIHPISSMYWWDGEIKKDTECAALIKMLPSRSEQVVSMLKEIHPYDTPCMVQWASQAESKFFEWAKGTSV